MQLNLTPLRILRTSVTGRIDCKIHANEQIVDVVYEEMNKGEG